MIISHQAQRKFAIIVPTLTGTYDLSSTYMSYTETTGSYANVWKATSGTLTFTTCSNGGLYIFTTDVDMSAFTTPSGTNQATGGFKVNIGYRGG